jgi:predicted CoA-binding protein
MVESYKTLVLGASLNPERYSHKAILMLRKVNVPVVAFGLRDGTVSDVEIEVNLKAYKSIHTVTLYLNPKRQEEFVEYILSLNPKRVIFNPGTENPGFFKLLKQHNIFYEMACTLVLLSTNQYQS